ncbi:flagellar protein FlaG [Bacillus sp. C11]|nr:flagellar protein FlaG [Neobacillus terrae]NHM29954.1 flagellar protein FlaG [Neobacillus terrae]
MMIDRVSAPIIPNQQRIATSEGVKLNQNKFEDNPSLKNQLQNQQPYQLGQKQKEKIEEVVKGLNDFLQPAHTSLKFKLHEKLNEYYVTIVDDNTNEVVNEIPSKKLLDIFADMKEHLGLLMDKKI